MGFMCSSTSPVIILIKTTGFRKPTGGSVNQDKLARHPMKTYQNQRHCLTMSQKLLRSIFGAWLTGARASKRNKVAHLLYINPFLQTNCGWAVYLKSFANPLKTAAPPCVVVRLPRCASTSGTKRTPSRLPCAPRRIRWDERSARS